MEEEVWEIGEARWPLEAGRVVLGEVPKLGSYPDEDSVQPSQHVKDVLLTTPAHKRKHSWSVEPPLKRKPECLSVSKLHGGSV